MTDGMMERDDNKKPSGNSGSSVSYTRVKEITEATNLTITTSGTSSATIRTDRGGGTVTVDKGTYTTNAWGKSGSNGGIVTLVMNNQSAIGNISVLNDSDSSYSNIDFNGYKLYVNGVAINN